MTRRCKRLITSCSSAQSVEITEMEMRTTAAILEKVSTPPMVVEARVKTKKKKKNKKKTKKVKKFSCTICGLTYGSNSSLARHRRISRSNNGN